MDHRPRRDIEVGVGAGAVHVTLVAEHIGRAPEQLDTGLGLLLLEVGDDLLEIRLILLDGRRLIHQVHIVEAVITYAQLLHDLKTGVHLVLGPLDGGRTLVPGEMLGAGAELVAALGAERVPPGHGELEPVFHLAAGDDALGLIVVERKRILGLLPFKRDLSKSGEILFHCLITI